MFPPSYIETQFTHSQSELKKAPSLHMVVAVNDKHQEQTHW